MTSDAEIKHRLAAIEERNQRVEIDKRWETSKTRRFCIMLLTYATVLLFLYLINNDNPPINALVPTGGFGLSTLALRKVRKVWEQM